MAGIITTGNFPKALLPGVKAWWGRSYNEHPPEYAQLFDWDTSTMAYEEDVQVTGFGLAPVKPEGGSISYDSESQGYVSRYTHVAYGLGFKVTREEQDDGKYEAVSRRRSEAIGFSGRQTKENVAANVYNRAFDSNYTFGDGKELIATDHPTLAGNFANEPSAGTDFSEAALEDLIIQIMGATNSRGLKISLMPTKLIVPRQLAFDAERVLKSSLQSGTANNDLNALRSMGLFRDGATVNHYLSDQDAWFIRTNAPRGMIAYQRVAAEMSTDNDFDTKNASFAYYERYAVGNTDPRGVFGSPGA